MDRRLKLAACPDTPSVEGPVMGAAVLRCAPVGWRIRLPLRGGEMDAASDKAAILVKKGDPVQLIACNASITVSTTKIADEDGEQGDMIRVRAERRSAPVVARRAV